MLRQSTDQIIRFVLTTETIAGGTAIQSIAHTGDATLSAILCKTGAAPAASTNSIGESGSGVYTLELTTAETDTIGDLAIVITYNGGANVLGIHEQVVDPGVYDGGGLDAAGVRTAVGLGSANLDTQLAGILAAEPTAASIRTAVGLGSANLDTQLSALSTLNAAGVRTALGLGSANLDTQLAGILAAEPTAASIRAAVGLGSANLDTQLAGILSGEPTAAFIRAALGEATANLDTQFSGLTGQGASILAAVPNAAAIRAAVGLATANLDTQIAGLNPLSAAGIRTAVGLAAANLDTQLTPLSQVNAIKAATDRLPNVPAATGDAMTLVNAYDRAKSAAQPGDPMTLGTAYDKAKTAAQPGDAMTLTPAYDSAKTCAQPGDAVQLGGSNLNALGAALATLSQQAGLSWYVSQQLKICAELLEGLPS